MRVLTICLLMIASLPMFAQTTWVMEVTVQGGCNCADGERSNDLTGTWNGTVMGNVRMFPPDPFEGTVTFQITNTTGDFHGTVGVSGFGDCYPNDPLNTGYATQGGSGSWSFDVNHTASDGCTLTGGSAPIVTDFDHTYNMMISVNIYPRLNPLTISDGGCATGSVVINENTSPVGGSYQWYLTDDPTSTWHLVPGESGSTLAVTPTMVAAAGLSSGNVYAILTDPGCPSRDVVQTTAFTVFAQSPSTTTAVTPVTCNGASNGQIKVTISHDQNVNSLVVRLFNWGADVANASPQATLLSNGGPVTFTGLTAASYTVTATNNTNTSYLGTCRSAEPLNPVNVTQPAALSVSFSGSANVSCNTLNSGTNNDGSIQIQVNNGTPGFSFNYSINGAAEASVSPTSTSGNTATFTGLSKANYQFRVTSDANSCGSPLSSTMAVGEPAQLKVTPTSPVSQTDVSCKGKNTGAIFIDVVGGNGTNTYAWTGPSGFTSGVQDPSSLYAGPYSLTLTDQKGCGTIYGATINEPTNALSVTGTVSVHGSYNVSCVNDGEILLSHSGTIYNITSYQWTKNGSPYPSATDDNPTGLSAASYGVKIVDQIGCDASTTFNLTGNPGISAVASATSLFNGYNTKCNSPTSIEGAGKVTVTGATGTIKYQWDSDPSDQAQTVSDLAPGTYHVQVSDDALCTSSATLVITAPPAILPNAIVTSAYNGAQISCAGENDGQITATPANGLAPYTYSWDHDASLTTNIASGLTKGSYKVTVTDSYGCYSAQTVSLSDPAKMKFIFNKTLYNGSDVSCYGQHDGAIQPTVLNALGNPTSFIYQWDNGATTKDVSGIGKGSYNFTVTDGNGCMKDSTVVITEPDELVVTLPHINQATRNSYDITCFGLSDGEARADVLGGTKGAGDYIYTWSNGVNTQVNPTLLAGTYSIIVKDLNMCSATSSITLTEPMLLTISAIVDNAVSCFGLSDGKVTIAGAGGIAPYNYSQDQSSWDIATTFAGLSTGNQDFYVKDNNGCQANITKFIDQPDVLQLSFADHVDAACNNPEGSVRAVVVGGNGAYNYQWLDEATNTPMNTGDQLVNAIAGIYRVNVQDSKNCSISDLTSVSSIGGAVFNVTNVTPVSCFGDSNGSALIVVSSGSSPFGYSWSDGQLTAQAGNLAAGRYFATVQDSYGCKTIQQVNIGTPARLLSTYNKTLPLCVGDCNGIILANPNGGTAPYAYEWIGLNNSNNQVNNLCAGSYTLKVTDSNNCVLQEAIDLSNPAPLVVNALISNPTCLGRCDASIVATGQGGTGPYTFDWGSLGVNSSVNNLCPNDYHVTMKDAHDCPADNTFTVKNGKPLPIDLGTKATLCVGQSKILDVGTQWVTVAWTSSIGFASAAASVSVKDPGDYFFKGIDARGCVALDTFHLETSLDLLKAEFLMPATAIVGDTIVAIDISWPVPERIEWEYPSSFVAIESPMDDILLAQVNEAGTYTVGVRTFLAECRDLREKTLIVSKADDAPGGGRLGAAEDLILDFNISPNPNNGQFSAHVKLSQDAPITLRVVQHTTGILMAETDRPSSTDHHVDFDLSSLAPATYVLLLTVNDTQRFIRFMKL